MKKVKLTLSELKVESFETAQKQKESGTVNANATGILCPTESPDCPVKTAIYCYTIECT